MPEPSVSAEEALTIGKILGMASTAALGGYAAVRRYMMMRVRLARREERITLVIGDPEATPPKPGILDRHAALESRVEALARTTDAHQQGTLKFMETLATTMQKSMSDDLSRTMAGFEQRMTTAITTVHESVDRRLDDFCERMDRSEEKLDTTARAVPAPPVPALGTFTHTEQGARR
jgi:hypothetical protein